MTKLPQALLPPSASLEALQGNSRATIEWDKFAVALRRYPRSILVALLSAWTLLAAALWLALIIGIIGAIVGASYVGSSTFTLGTGQAGGILGSIAGFFIGAGIAFVFVYGQGIRSAGPHILISLLIGLVFAMVLTMLLIWLEHWLMYFRGYRPPSRREAAIIAPVLADVQAAMGLDSLPQILVADHGALGAWAHTRHVVLSHRLLDEPREQLAAVLAHELHHWRSGDSVALLLVSMCAWPLAFTANAIVCIRNVAGKFGAFITGSLLWPFTVISRFIISPVLALESRKYEYEADAAAVRAGFGLGMMQTLEALKIFEPARTGWETVVNASHPPNEYRIEAVEEDMAVIATAPAPSEIEPKPRRRTRQTSKAMSSSGDAD